MPSNQICATGLRLVNWSRFQNETIRLEGSALLTGANGTGKSTILDAMSYLLVGNTQFNKAAKDKDRSVKAYVRGDTKSHGKDRYLRSGAVVSYVAMEFHQNAAPQNFVLGVVMESPDETSCDSWWFVCPDCRLSDITFVNVEGDTFSPMPRRDLQVHGQRLPNSEFRNREKGVRQVMQALGLRGTDVRKYRSKLLKMMAFNPETNIDRFIRDSVLETEEIHAIGELRQHRESLDQLQEEFNQLTLAKEQLERVEVKTQEFESRRKSYHMSDILLPYQTIVSGAETMRNLEINRQTLKQELTAAEEKKPELAKAFDNAIQKLMALENNDMLQRVREYERQKDEAETLARKLEEETAELVTLRQKLFVLLSIAQSAFPLTPDEQKCLEQMSTASGSADDIHKTFVKLSADGKEYRKTLEADEVHTRDRRAALVAERNECQERIGELEANRFRYPDQPARAKAAIEEVFRSEHISSEVRFFSELVVSVKKKTWARPVETFLGGRRFDIIVDGEYCHRAMQVLQERNLYGATVVLTDKLPTSEVVPGSAAEQLDIPNPEARKYANYLLNRLHLCETLEELHDHPTGGLMKNGMLAVSYGVKKLRMEERLFFGADAIKQQLKHEREQLELLEQEHQNTSRTLDDIRTHRNSLEAIDWNAAHYNFAAAMELTETKTQVQALTDDIKLLRNDPNFLELNEKRVAAQADKQRAEELREANDKRIGSLSASLDRVQEDCRKTIQELSVSEKLLEEKKTLYPDVAHTVEEEYERRREKSGDIQVIQAKSVERSRNKMEAALKEMEDAQREYRRINNAGFDRYGVSYIPEFREEYRNIAVAKIERAKERLKDQRHRMEEAFLYDFVAELGEKMRDAKLEIQNINDELSHTPFGNDTYRFEMKEREDRRLFFRILDRTSLQLEGVGEYDMDGDVGLEEDIRTFMETILSEEDESEYSDYRNYFTYDMTIRSREGSVDTRTSLSEKQGSASNGEKQTPHFIILAASLMQCYHAPGCARLAFIDEAFSALSRERIEQMVKYLEANDFQVIYAAPPEKVGSIGSFVNTTATVYTSGRYSHVVEGMEKAEV